MNARQRVVHELYHRKVCELNETSQALQKRRARCDYLKDRMDAATSVWNVELAEAYADRLLSHQKLIDEVSKKVIKLKNELERMPRVWIA